MNKPISNSVLNLEPIVAVISYYRIGTEICLQKLGKCEVPVCEVLQLCHISAKIEIKFCENTRTSMFTVHADSNLPRRISQLKIIVLIV